MFLCGKQEFYNLVAVQPCYRIGRKSARLVRAAALRLAQELLTILTRPLYVSVTRVLEGLAACCSHYVIIMLAYCSVEPMVFRLKFLDWNDLIAVDYTIIPQTLPKVAEQKVS